MPLDFGPHPDVVYRQAPLTTVLCQIKFSPIVALMSEVGIAGFQEAIRREYPVLGKEGTASVAISDNRVGIQQQPPVWRFKQPDSDWAVGLAIDFVSLEVTSYTNFGDFLRRLRFVLNAAQHTLYPSSSTRIGLRKVNELSPPDDVDRPSAWRNYLKPELLGLVGVQDWGVGVSASLSETRFRDDMNYLAVRHGLHPEEDKELTYLLDLDYFTDRPFEVGPDEGICDLLQGFSDGITSFFHWAIAPGLLEAFGPIPRQRQE